MNSQGLFLKYVLARQKYLGPLPLFYLSFLDLWCIIFFAFQKSIKAWRWAILSPADKDKDVVEGCRDKQNENEQGITGVYIEKYTHTLNLVLCKHIVATKYMRLLTPR